MAEVFRLKLASIQDLKTVIEDLVAELSGDVICGVMVNFRHRCKACIEADGGTFEYFLH